MAKKVWYRWEWEDGTVSICRGYNKLERQVMERHHGRLLYKCIAY